ncbi:MAG: hypothetical protein Q8P89_02715 [bacterium]|nr:hypothetical protein [bacterium]
MKKLLPLTLAVLFLFLTFKSEAAAKLLPQAQKGGKAVSVRSGGSGITVSARLRGDRKALLVNLGNLQNAKSVSYILMYNANGQDEGVGGALSSLEGTQSRELLFGTCSKNVCRYHTNITSAKLEVTYTLTSGKKYLKRYRIRV